MYFLSSGIRLIQTWKSKKENKFFLVGKNIDDKIVLNRNGASLLLKFHKNNLNNEFTKNEKLLTEYSQFFDFLKKENVLVNTNCLQENIFLIKKSPKLPLSSLNIEITDGCNLQCIHCYNDFGHRKINFINKDALYSLLDDLNYLNTFSIAITGGEATIHPDFIEICKFFVDKGFRLTLFTNGFHSDKIIELLKLYPKTNFTIKVSLDGFKDQHNLIRNNNYSYSNCINFLNKLKKYKNIEVYISSTIMRENIEFAAKFKDFIKNEFPDFIYGVDLITPCKTNQAHSFRKDEFNEIYEQMPSLLNSRNSKSDKFRCSGGRSQATLMVDGGLKICNGAVDEIFKFQYNAFDKGLIRAWDECGKNIAAFRKEKNKSMKTCKKCELKRECKITNCRIISYAYNGDCNTPNPIICFYMKNVNKL